MKILLDTHTFLWFSQKDAELPPLLYDKISDTANEIFVSVVSLWEIAIKIRIGKLELLDSLEVMLDKALDEGFKILMIRPEHIFLTKELPLHHRDPFDRMIVTQGMIDKLTIASKDSNFYLYPVPILWNQLTNAQTSPRFRCAHYFCRTVGIVSRFYRNGTE